jgi:hypothetical protein
MLARQNENALGCRELKKNRSENQKDPGVLDKRSRLIDPELHDCSREKKQRDYKIFRRLRLLAAKDQEREPGDERGQDNDFDVARGLECTQ